jgi:hypothetical protein
MQANGGGILSNAPHAEARSPVSYMGTIAQNQAVRLKVDAPRIQ